MNFNRHEPNYPRGTEHFNHRLTEDDVRLIRREYAEGNTTMQKIANAHHVTRQQVYKIIHRLRWAHLDD